jgi:predicted phosphate transport protein (TIGR00153 family)
MNGLQQVIRFFLPQETHFFDHLDAVSKAADDAAKGFVELTRAQGREQQLALVERIREAEHAGDKGKKEMSDALDRTFVTPIDREDLYHLCSALESVSDFISATANHLTVHQMDTLPDGSKEMADILLRCTTQFSEAVALLRHTSNFDRIRAAVQSLHYMEHECDVIFRLRLGDLFAKEKDAITLIKHKEFLEGLENAVDRCASVGTVLEAVVIKNG